MAARVNSPTYVSWSHQIDEVDEEAGIDVLFDLYGWPHRQKTLPYSPPSPNPCFRGAPWFLHIFSAEEERGKEEKKGMGACVKQQATSRVVGTAQHMCTH